MSSDQRPRPAPRPRPIPRGARPVDKPRPVRKARPWSRTGLAVSLVSSVAVMVALFGVGAALVDIGRGDAAPATPSRSPARKAATLKQPVRDGKFEFVVQGVDCSRSTVGVEHLKRTAAGRYCVISLSIRNIADRPQLFLGKAQKVVDAGGKEFRDDEAAGLFANRTTQTFLRKIDPGRQVRGKVVFDVPKSTKLTEIELHDSYFSGGVRVALK
jgi:hypothetical protein